MPKIETIPKKEHDRIVEILHKEILRKDKIIEKLKDENKILLKTSVKRATDYTELTNKTKKILEK